MEIVIASDNEEKIKEFKILFSSLNFKIISKKEAGCLGQIEETGKTFEENAKIKAEYVFKKTSIATLADDSGLEVFALNNQPGVFSARYSATKAAPATDEKNNLKLLNAMKNIEDRKARYVCALCFINNKGQIFKILKTVNGEIAKKPRGKNGFGYDPIFLFEGRSFAEYSSDFKNKISHRAKALHSLLQNINIWI